MNLTFGEVLHKIQNENPTYSRRFAREGWNGKKMYIYFVPANSYAALTDSAKEEFGEMVPYGCYMAFKSAQGTVEAGWRPTSVDMFTADWVEV